MNAQYKVRDYYASPIVIGTRGSPLAVAQAEETRSRLMSAHGLFENAFLIKIIQTTGDMVQDRPLSEIGGKGLFTVEIEDSLLSGAIDIAVHSMKDMPTSLPSGLTISTVLPREDVRDSFVSLKYRTINELPKGCTVGTSSLRRRAQLLSQRPDLKVVEFRGNVQTRLRKLDEGVAEATFLACAGLARLGLNSLINPIPINEMLPAVAQGAIGIEQKSDNESIRKILEPIHDKNTELQLLVERSFLAELDGSCRTPIGGLAIIKDTEITFHGEILKPDGSQIFNDVWSGHLKEASSLGKNAGKKLKEKGGEDFFK
jgi:hydroxymethylbilane synthase